MRPRLRAQRLQHCFSAMVLVKNSLKETYYDILSIQENASYEEIRSSYRTLCLNYHQNKLRMSNSAQIVGDRFLKIRKAWEVLCDSKSRRAYDNELQVSKQDMAAAAEDVVGLCDMMIEDSEEEAVEFYYPCRCGDYFSVDSHELEEMGHPLSRDGSRIELLRDGSSPATFVIPCGSCSLKICLVLQSDSDQVL